MPRRAAKRATGPKAWPYPEWLLSVAADPAYDWAVRAWDRAAAVEGAWFDHALADEMVRQWPILFKLTQDRFAGKPFKLVPWQELIVRLMVGWMRPEVDILDPDTGLPTVEQVRLFRRLLLWIPRKNGKSEFMAALGLLFFIVDGVVDGEGYCFARTEKQARIVLKKMKAMIASNPEWSGSVQAYKRSFYVTPLMSGFELLTGAEEGKHGASPTVVIGDEMHEWRSRMIADTLEEGTGARLQPVFLYGSTTGTRAAKTGVELWDESQGILEGRLTDPTTLVVVFAAAANDDWQDEEVWRKANPSIGLSPTWSFLRRAATLAKDNPREEARFRCYHLNQWIDDVVRWLNLKKWDACAKGKPEQWRSYQRRLKGRACFGAFDVSATRDVTALVWVFPPTDKDPQWRVLCRFWVPEQTVDERLKTDRVDYRPFLRAKDLDGRPAMETTPGDFVDQNFVKKAILEGFKDFDVQKLGYDSWNASKLISDLQNEGVDVEQLIEMRQGIPTLGEPSKHFERLVYAGLLDHGGHPVLRWMAQNVVVRFDENLNFAPAKKRSGEKIDGIVSAVMGVGLACAGEEAGVDISDFLQQAAMFA